MSRRRIWLIIIGILMAGVSATWEMEKFVSSHGVNTAAVVGFEADAMQPDAGNPGNPYMTENRMKVAENTPAAQNDQLAVSGGADEAAGIPVEETVKSPLEPDSTASENAGEAKLVIEYTRSDLEERLEAVRTEAEKYQDDQTMSQTSRYATAEYVRNLWDCELNLIYSSIRKEMDESAAEALRREEVEWIRKRDLAADKASAKSNSTPSQSIEYVRTSASVTMDRCYELLENYGDYLEPEKN